MTTVVSPRLQIFAYSVQKKVHSFEFVASLKKLHNCLSYLLQYLEMFRFFQLSWNFPLQEGC